MKIKTAKVSPVPCKRCGELPQIKSVDVHFRMDDVLITTNIEIRCPTPACNAHAHYTPRATRREAILSWNSRNSK